MNDTEPKTSTDPIPDTPSPAESVPTAEAAPSPAPASEAEGQLEAARREAAAHHERYLRAVADLENFRKRMVREKDELRQFAAGRVIEDLLPVLDNLGFGLAAAKAPNADLASLAGGIGMVETQFKAALVNHGLKEIHPAGQVFDPNQHEAVSQQPSAEVPEGSVLQVVRTGYSLNGRLLRPASVIVSAGPAPEADAKA